MSFPFVSTRENHLSHECVEERAGEASPQDLNPTRLAFRWLSRCGGRLLRPRHARRRQTLTFEPLEPRLLLAADLGFDLANHFAAEGDVTLRVLQENESLSQVQYVELVDNTTGWAFETLRVDPGQAVMIMGTPFNDTLVVDAGGAVSFGIVFDGGAGFDTLAIETDRDTQWTIDGDNAGRVEGPAAVEFRNTEVLRGAAGNDDTFVFQDGGALAGLVDGGDAGFDTLVVAGGSYERGEFIVTGPDSGSIVLDGSVITYAGLEPVDTRGVVFAEIGFVGSRAQDTVRLEQLADGTLQLVGDGFEDHLFSAPTSAINIDLGTAQTDPFNPLFPGRGADRLIVDVSGLSASINVTGLDDVIIDGATDLQFGGDFHVTAGRAIIVEDGASIETTGRIDLLAVATGNQVFGLVELFLQEIASEASITIGAADLQATAVTMVADTTTVQTAIFDIFSEGLGELIEGPLAELTQTDDSVQLTFIDNGVKSLTGNPELVFDAAARSITRDAGSWIVDGFLPGGVIVVAETDDNDGTYDIATVSGDGRTLFLVNDPDLDDDLVDETRTGARVTTPVADVIRRSSGSWIADGFEKDDVIKVIGSRNNDSDDFTIGAVTPLEITLIPTDTLQNETEDATYDIVVKEAFASVVSEDVPLVSLDRDGNAILGAIKSGALEQQLRRLVTESILGLVDSPFQYIEAMASSEIVVADNASINALGDISLVSSAVSDVQLNTPTLILGAAWGESSATARTTIGSDAVIASAAGSVAIDSLVSNTMRVQVGMRAGLLFDTITGLLKIPGPQAAVSYGKAQSTSEVAVANGATISGQDVSIAASNTNDFDVAATSQKDPTGGIGASIGVAISDTTSTSGVSVAGEVIAAESATVGSQSVNLNNDIEAKGAPKKKIPIVSDKVSKLKDSLKKQVLDSKSNPGALDIGAGVAIANSSNSAAAGIAAGGSITANAGGIDVTSRAEDNFKAIASGGAKSGAKVSIAGAVAVTDYVNEATSSVGDGARLAAAQAVRVTADAIIPNQIEVDDDLARILAIDYSPGAFDGSDPVSFLDSVDSFLVETSLLLDPFTQLTPYLSKNLGADDKIATSYVSASSEAGNNGFAISGAVNVMSVTNTARAWIGEGAVVTGSQVIVTAKATAESINIHGIPGIVNLVKPTNKSGGSGVGGTYSGITYVQTAEAYIDDTAQVTATDGNVEVKANTENFIVNVVESGGKAAKVGISGAFALNRFTNTTLAYIEDKAQVSATADVIVDADTSILGVNVVGTINQSEGIGFGVSLAVNEIKNETKAFIGNRTLESVPVAAAGFVAAGSNLQVKARSNERLYGVAIAAAALTNTPDPTGDKQSTGEAVGNNAAKGAKNSSGVNVSGDVSLNFVDDTTHAYIADMASVTVGQDLTIEAKNTAFILAISGAFALDLTKGSGGSFTLAGSFTENDLDRDVRAYTQNTTITADDVSIAAETRDKILSISASAGGSLKSKSAGVFGEVNLNLIDSVTLAGLWDGTNLTAAGDLSVRAVDDLILTSVAGGLGVTGRATIGAGVDVGVINRHVAATIGAPDGGLGPAVTADMVTLAAAAKTDIVSVAAHISVAFQNLGFAGAAASQTLDVQVRAGIADGASVDADGDVVIRADDDSRFVVVGGAIGFAGTGAGIGAGVANLNLDRGVDAFIDGARVTAVGDILVDATAADVILGIGAAGAGSSSVALAGSVVVLTLDTLTRASIAGDASTPVSADGNVRVGADSDADIDTIAGNLAFSGSTGFGASNTTIVRTDTTEAFVGDGAVVDAKGNGDAIVVPTGEAGALITDAAFFGLSVTATSREDLLTIAAGGVGAGSAGIAGSATVNILDETTRAFIGAGAAINQADGNAGAAVGQGVNLLARDDTKILAVAGAIAGGGSVGVGAGADVGVIDKLTEAFIGAGTNVDATGDVKIQAIAEEKVISVSALLGIGGSAGIAGSAGVYVLDLATRAYVAGGATPAEAATVAAGGNVLVAASDETTMDIIAGNVAGAGSVAVGASAAVVTSTKETIAYIGTNADVTANAETAGLRVFAGEFDIGFVADAPNENFSKRTDDGLAIEEAEVGARPPTGSDLDFNDDGSDDTTDGSLSMQRQAAAATMAGARGVIVTASSQDDIETLALSGGAGGSVAVNIGGSVTVLDTTTSAFIDTGATVDSDASVHVAAASDVYHMGIAGVLSLSGTVAVTPGADVTVLNQSTIAAIGDAATVVAERDVTVTANASEDILSVSAGVAGSGQVAVAGNVSVIVLDIETKALIGTTAATDANGAMVDAGGNVLISARDTTEVDVIAGSAAIGIGAVGVGASVAVIDINKTTEAFVGSHAAVAAAGRVDPAFGTTGLAVEASSSEDVFSVAATVGGGFYAGVAGGVAVEIIDSDTRAFIGPNAAVNTASRFTPSDLQSVRVAAHNDATVFSVGGAIGAGIAGIGGGVDVGVLRNDVTATVMSGAEVNAAHDVEIAATSTKDVTTVAASIAGGIVGAVGSVSVWSIGTPVDAGYSTNTGSENALAAKGTDKGNSETPQFGSVDGFADKMAAGDTSGGGYRFLASGYATAAAFDPQVAVDSDADTITLPPSETFKTGDAVIYDAGDAGSAIGGLVDGEVYYVIVVDEANPSVVKLAASRAAALADDAVNTGAIDLDAAAASGGTHRLNPLAGGATSRANSGVGAAAPASGSVMDAVSDPVAQPPGTEAAIAANAIVRAGHDVHVKAADRVAFEGVVGSIAGGVGALGASILVADVQSTVRAHIDGTVRAGNDVSVRADFSERADAIAFAGRAGLVALGAQVIVYTDSSVQEAFIADGADVRAGVTVALPSGEVAPADGNASLTVDAVADIRMALSSVGGGVAGVAAGASVVRGFAQGTTLAAIEGTAIAGQAGVAGAGVVGNVAVLASATLSADAEGKAINASLVGGEGHDARIELKPTVDASVGNGARVEATGAVTVQALTDLFGESDSAGINLGVLTVAVSIARTTITPNVRAWVGRGADIAADGSVRILATAEHDARAKGTPSGGGAISGTGTDTRAIIGGSVLAEVRSGATVRAGADIEVGATADNDARSRGDGLAVGFAGVSGIVSKATVGGSTKARAFADANTTEADLLIAGRDIVIGATESSYADAFAQASSGGLLSGAGADAAATVNRAVHAELAGDTNADFAAGNDVKVVADGDLRAKGFSRGSAVGGLSAGVSLADATVRSATPGQPLIKALLAPDGDATIDAGNNIIVEALFNLDSAGNGINHAANAEAVSSSGSLIGGSGADADAVSEIIVLAAIDGLATPDEARTIGAGNDLTVLASSYNGVRSKADGDNTGLATAGSTNASANLSTRSSTTIGTNAFLTAGRDLNVDSLAVSNVVARTEGGTGRTIGDFIEGILKDGLSGLFNNIPSLLSVGAAVTAVDVDSLAETIVGSGARLIAEEDLRLAAKTQTIVDADSSMTSRGITAAAAIATTDVIVDPNAKVIIGADAVIEGNRTTVSAINEIQVDAFASSLAAVNVAGAFSTAASKTDIGRGAGDKSEARIEVHAGARVVGTERLVLEALGREKSGDILSRSQARADTGVLATATATAQGSSDARSVIETAAGSQVKSKDLQIRGETAYDIARGPDAAAEGFITKTVKVVQQVVRKITKWLPWPLDKIVEWVVDTVITFVTVFEFSFANTDTGGRNDAPDDIVRLDGDILIGDGAEKILVVDEGGNVVPLVENGKETPSDLIPVITDDEIIVPDIANEAEGKVFVQASRGLILGDATLFLPKVLQRVYIENRSDKDLILQGIDVISDNAGEPDAVFIDSRGIGSGPDFRIETLGDNGSQLIIRNTSTSDIIFSKPINADPNKQSLLTLFDVSNEGGSILMDKRSNPDDVIIVAGDSAGMFREMELGLEPFAVLLETRTGGTIGTETTPFKLRLVRGKDFPDGTLANVPAALFASAYGDLIVDVQGVNIKFTNVDPSQVVDGIVLDLASQTGDVKAQLRAGELREQVLVDGPPTPIELQGAPDLIFEDGVTQLTGDPALTFEDGVATLSGDPLLTFEDGRIELSGNPELTFTDNGTNAVSGTPSLSFRDNGDDPDTIERDTGDWLADGFGAGQLIAVSGSTSNDGFYRIADISAQVLTLVPEDALAFEDGAGIAITSNTADTIGRSSGSWSDDGFKVGQTITVSGSTDNDGVYQITAISTDGALLTLGDGDRLTSEAGAGAAVSADVEATLTRSDGNWLDDGFARNQVITVSGSADNDRDFEILSLSLDGRVLAIAPVDAAAAVIDEVDAAGVGVTSQPSAQTITRATGSWLQDGFRIGQDITVSGAGTSNDATLTIVGLTAATITVDGAAIVDQKITGGVSIETAQGDKTITRTSGSWLDDGFGVGSSITVTGTRGNDGVYTIADVTDSVLELTPAAAIVDERAEAIIAESLSIAADGTITRGDGGDWESDGLVDGQTVRLFGTAKNDGIYRVAAVTATVLTLTPVGDGSALQVESVDLALLGGVTVVSEQTRTITQSTSFASRPAPTVYQSIQGEALQGNVLLEVTGDLDIGIFGALSGNGLLNAPGGDVTVIATGNIFDSDADEAADIIAANVTIVSLQGGIGTADNPIEIDSGNGVEGALIAAAAGDIYVDEVNGPLAVVSATSTGGDIRLTVRDTADSGEDLILVDGGQINAADGAVLLRAGDGVTTSASSAITASEGVTILGDFGNADPGFGSTMLLRGSIIGQPILILGNVDDDAIRLDEVFLGGPATVLGGEGADLITVNRLQSMVTSTDGQRDRLKLDGEGGADAYVVNVTPTTPNGVFGSDYIINVLDSGTDAAEDTLTVNGTADDDVFLLRKVTEIPGETADDPAFVAHLHGTVDEVLARVRDSGEPITVERINYDAGIARLFVNGLDGADYIAVDDNSAITTIDGGAGDDSFQVGQLFGSARFAPDVAPEDAFDTVETTRGFLSRGVSMATTILGGDGEDTFSVYSNQAPLDLRGEAGNDTFVIRAFALVDGSGGFATTDTTVNAGSGDDMVQYSINAPVTIDGGDGFDTIVAIGTEFADIFVVTEDGIFGLGLDLTITDVEAFEVDALEGDDTIFVLSTPENVVTTIIGNLGSDQITIGGDVVGTVVTGGGSPLTPTSDGVDLDVRFPIQPHSLDRIRGPIIVEGGVGETDRSLRAAVVLPNEEDAGPIAVDIVVDETQQVDTLSVFNDDSIANDVGMLTPTNLSGLGMSETAVVVPGGAGQPDVTVAAGITYRAIEILEILLGQGDDALAILGTHTTDAAHGGLTVVHGGGGSDTITVAGRSAPLVIYGDTSEDGARYGSTPTKRSANANAFTNPGEDVIDASASQASIIAYGGPGDDIIIGSQAGDDLAGGEGNDLIDGQAGDDRIYGDFKFNVDVMTRVLTVVESDTPGDDDLIGGLGDDTIYGNAGHDTIIGDVGLIFRVENADGTPVLNANGSQQRAIVLLEAASVTGVLAIDSTARRDLTGIGEAILAADVALVTGAFDAQGEKVLNDDNGAWDTNLLLLDLSVAGNDRIFADAGDDVVFGQRGDDWIWGGDGDDALFGDGGNNATTVEAGLPHVLSGFQLTGSAVGDGLDIADGRIIVPAMSVAQDALGASIPVLTQATTGVPGFTALLANNTVPRGDGTSLTPLLAIVTDLINDPSVMPGNDLIFGEAGNDLIVGDNLEGFSPLVTGLTEIDDAIDDVRDTVIALTQELYHLMLGNALLETQFGPANAEANTLSAAREVRIASDEIHGGTGNDRIVGDDLYLIAPANHDIPGLDPTDVDGTLQDAALAFHGFLKDLRLAIVDFGMVVEEAQVQTLRAIVDASLADNPTGTKPKLRDIVDPNIIDLVIENDVIDGGEGDDLMVGDDSFHIVANPGSPAPTAYLDTVDRGTLRDVKQALRAQDLALNRVLGDHVGADHENVSGRLPSAIDLKVNPFEFQFDRSLGNDVIVGGDGDDLIIGDYNVSVILVVPDAPTTTQEQRAFEKDVLDAIKETGAYFRAFQHETGNAAFKSQPFNGAIDAKTYGVRNKDSGIVLTTGNDDLSGDAGDDTIVGDSQSIIAAIAATDPRTPLDVGARNLNIKPKLKDFRRILEHPSSLLPGSVVVAEQDTVNGGLGDNLLVAERSEIVPGGGNDSIRPVVAASDLAGFIVPAQTPWLEQFWLGVLDAEARRSARLGSTIAAAAPMAFDPDTGELVRLGAQFDDLRATGPAPVQFM